MSDANAGSPGEASRSDATPPRQRVPLFSLLNLLLLALCLGVFSATVSAGARTGSLGYLVVSVAAGVVLVPLVYLASVYTIALVVLLLVLVFGNDVPASTWLGRLQILLRGAVIAATVTWLAGGVTRVWHVASTTQRKEAIMLGVVLPLCVLFLFAMRRCERQVDRRTQTAESARQDRENTTEATPGSSSTLA